jgi:hypothetical protein
MPHESTIDLPGGKALNQKGPAAITKGIRNNEVKPELNNT